MGKDAMVPAAVVRGVSADAPLGRARDLVRPREDDLFRESPLVSLSARRTIRSFGQGDVPRDVIEEAVRAACTAPAPHHTRPWLFAVLTSDAAKRTLLGAIAQAWREDLRRDATPETTIERRLAKSDAVLGAAPVLVVPFVRFAGSCWISSTLFCQQETRAALGIDDEWHALGTVAAGRMPAGAAAPPRPPLDIADVLMNP
jgi:coenzyme F420-0:L-glutamate ligase/coenzyme F420-1:gamma-L-glutamate ligase